jgi:pyridinium-3,5-biscarboxylic acid mononucleotide sulfurtransferase
MQPVADLERWFEQGGRVVLGYSGGVDSTLLAVVGFRTLGPHRFLAVIGRSASYPAEQWARARAVAEQFGFPVEEIDTDELSLSDYRANSPDRCFFCKQELWTKLDEIRAGRGFELVIDGTMADDLREHRPGARAGREAGVRSPLVELGWGKAQVRRAAADAGIPSWNAPAAPCLASRIRYGLEVTAARLGQVERAEAFLRELGVDGDLRVRHHDTRASIEVEPRMFGLVGSAWPAIVRRFGELGWSEVARDPRGYRRGALLPLAGEPTR